MCSHLHIALLVLLTGLLTGCSSASERQGNGQNGEKILVAAAANVQFAIAELEVLFEQETGIAVDFVVSSSGKLTAQILQGAPYDLLVSADLKYPATLEQEGMAGSPVRAYALGMLVLWTNKEIDLIPDPHFLKDPSIHKIAMANPKTAPYGEQAVNLLRYYGIYEAVESKLVFGESIAQTNQYILSGACELGFTAKSVVLSPDMEGQGKWVDTDAKAYSPIVQGLVITRYGREHHPAASERFFNFMLSPAAREVLTRYGYQAPPAE